LPKASFGHPDGILDVCKATLYVKNREIDKIARSEIMQNVPKVYYYTDQEVGVPWPGPDADFLVNGKPKVPNTPWPRFEWCAFAGFETTTNPHEADIFVVRQRLIWLSREQVYGLRYLNSKTAHRHIFFDLGSDGDPKCFRDFPDIPAIFFRAAAGKAMMENTPTTIPWAWPVEDFSHYPLAPKHGFQYDVVFQGQVGSRPIGRRAVQQLKNTPQLNCHLMFTEGFYGHMSNGKRRIHLRNTYKDTLHHGRLSLNPANIPQGVVRYRFYEALSMGRVPIYVDDLGVFPFEDRIDYSRCVVKLAENDLPNIGGILVDWLMKHTDQDIIDMGRYGREMWKRWMDRSRWAEIIEEIVREKLEL